MAIQTGAGAASPLRTRYDAGDDVRVEFRDEGFAVDLAAALDASAWEGEHLYHPSLSTEVSPTPKARGGITTTTAASGASLSSQACPTGSVRAFVGITSHCCSASARAKRQALRRSWVRDLRRDWPGALVKFVVAQPPSEAGASAAAELLRGEVAEHDDLLVVPGIDEYRELPNKTLQLLRYALNSRCGFTHIVKTDDDVYVRPGPLRELLETGRHDYDLSIDAPPGAETSFDGVPSPAAASSPWRAGMYVGALDSNRSGAFPGWSPLRDPRSKWYLSHEDLPDELAEPLLGVRWASGWAYVLSRDLAETVIRSALTFAASPARRPGWWGRMPWEDVMVAALLRDTARIGHSEGFKASWSACDSLTIAKHLDIDAPMLVPGLHAQDESGLWRLKEVVCSTSEHTPGNYTAWREWRNSLPDVAAKGYM